MKKLIEIPAAAEPVGIKSETDRVFETEPAAEIAVKVPGGYVVFDNAGEAQEFVKNPTVPEDIERVEIVTSTPIVESTK